MLITLDITSPSTIHSGHSQAVMPCGDNNGAIFLALEKPKINLKNRGCILDSVKRKITHLFPLFTQLATNLSEKIF